MLRLPRLSSISALVDAAGKPNGTFIQWWQQVVSRIEQAIDLIVELTGIQDEFAQALSSAQQATADAQAAANAAAASAAAAQAQADSAAAQADATKREAALQSSYIDPTSVLSADGDGLAITIAAHTRYYGDGTSVEVDGATVPATATGDVDYVSYDDPMRVGGAVAYIVTLTNPVQTGSTHVVGAVEIPVTGTALGGDGPAPPGTVSPLTS